MKINDPSPEQIAAERLAIQLEWSPAEKLKRLRCDWRPAFRRCDGEFIDMDSEAYERHHERRAELQEALTDD
jgi:hypothetical protein